MTDGFETRAIHVGQEPDAATGAVIPPISLSTTFAQDAVGKHRGYEYARSDNPTRHALETCVASLENARHGLAFASVLAVENVAATQFHPEKSAGGGLRLYRNFVRWAGDSARAMERGIRELA